MKLDPSKGLTCFGFTCGWRWYAVAFFLGFLLSLSLPPIYALPLLPVAFGGLLIMLSRCPSIWKAGVIGWWFGFGYFLFSFHWIGEALLVDPDRFGWFAAPAVIFLTAGLAIFISLAGTLVWLWPARGWVRALTLATAWAISEWLRGNILSGFPMSPIGISWSISDSMLQICAVIGVIGLSFITVFVSALPATQLCDTFYSGSRRTIFLVFCSLALLSLIWAGGKIRLAVIDTDYARERVNVRLVQGNIAQNMKWTPYEKQNIIQKYLKLSLVDVPSNVDVVIWPETAMPVYISSPGQLFNYVKHAIPKNGFLITGAPRIEYDGENKKIWNSLFVLESFGFKSAVYDKHHLVPFGEYIPLRSILGLNPIVESSIDFSSGPGPVTIEFSNLPPFSALICYEGIFPNEVVEKNSHPKWLLNITNDSWFGDLFGPHQHFQTVRLRSIEEGLPLLRVANTGISAIVNSLGEVEKSLELGREGIIDSAIPPPLENPTPYSILRDWVLLIFVFMAMLISLISVRMSSKLKGWR